VWKAIETEARKIGVAKTTGKRNENRRRKIKESKTMDMKKVTEK